MGAGISTLAPREGSDCIFSARSAKDFYFNPRSPRGERRGDPIHKPGYDSISTLAPREGSDELPVSDAVYNEISTLAPREGSDISPA